MPKELRPKELRLHIRITEELKKMVEELAAAENRDVTNYITTLIKTEHKKLKAQQNSKK